MDMKRILLAIWSDKSAARDVIYGFLKYTRERTDWEIDIRHEDDLEHPSLQHRIKRGDYDGIVVKERASLTNLWLFDLEKTALVLNATLDPTRMKKGGNLAYVQCDDFALGSFAGKYLSGLGTFASYAYIPTYPSHSWTEARKNGFSDFLSRRRAKCAVLTDGEPLTSFLRRLKKPAAVFAACDRVAIAVLETCRSIGLDIPGKVAVIGVDNDELICEFARPSLTSIIQKDPSKIGEMAGEAMNRLLKRRKPHSRPDVLVYNDLSVVERESCAHLPQATHVAYAAMEFISKHSGEAIKVGDVVRHLKVSRRLADRQFSLVHGESILEAITRLRLEKVAKRLLVSRLPIENVAALCGFTDVSYLGKLFRRRYGMSMRQYRCKAIHPAFRKGKGK